MSVRSTVRRVEPGIRRTAASARNAQHRTVWTDDMDRELMLGILSSGHIPSASDSIGSVLAAVPVRSRQRRYHLLIRTTPPLLTTTLEVVCALLHGAPPNRTRLTSRRQALIRVPSFETTR